MSSKVIRIQRVACVLIAHAVLICGRASAQNSCGLSSSDVDQLVTFLDQQNLTRTNPPCIEYAIDRLTLLRSPKAIPALINFLDFHEPLSLDEEAGRLAFASGHRGVEYKTVGALFAIGQAAAPRLLEVLRDPLAPPIKFKNALQAYLDIRREDLNNARQSVSGEIATAVCPSLQTATEQTLISLLEANEHSANNGDSGCLTSAIIQLGVNRSVKATKVLLDYINYEPPAAAASETSDPDHPLLYPRQKHPAVTALYLIGTPAVIQILHALQDNVSASSLREVEVIMLIYAEYPPRGITVINSALAKHSSAASLIQSAIQWCDIDHRVKCQELSRRTD